MKGSLAFIPHSSLIIPHSFTPSLTVGLLPRTDSLTLAVLYTRS